MPIKPPIFRPRHGRGSTADRAAAARDFDRRRLAESETRPLYKTARWRTLRAVQLSASPVCRLCEGEGRTTAATVCDHVSPHRGDVESFWRGPFQSLCVHCHNTTKQREEARQG
jgi:5-methylcytosine-specific restriction protein A